MIDLGEFRALLQLDPVLRTGEDALGPLDGGTNQRHFRGAVVHMVGKTQVASDLHACGLDLPDEMIGVPQPGADHDPRALEITGIDRAFRCAMSIPVDRGPDMTTDRVRRPPSMTKNQILDVLDRIAGPSDHHDVRTLQGTRWFTQPAVRQKITIETRSHGVDQDDIEIPVESSMLKTIVENQDVETAGILLQHPSGDAGAVGTHEKRKSRMSKSILRCFVGPPGAITPIPSQGDRGTGTAVFKCLGQVTAYRRLPRAPDGQVAHGNHRNLQTRGAAKKLPSDIQPPADSIRSRREIGQGRQCTREWSGSFTHSLVVPSSSSGSPDSRVAVDSCSRSCAAVDVVSLNTIR